MLYETLIDGMKKYGSTETDICFHSIGITPDQVRENVIIAPWWEPSVLPELGEAQFISSSDFSAVKVWNIISDSTQITYIKTGIGAPVLMDVVLSLGVTKCKKIIFIGSAGALDNSINIGDIVIPEYSICGDGASRYIYGNRLADSDCWGEKVYPDNELQNKLKEITNQICQKYNICWHSGKNFSVDTIFAQYAHIDEILNMGCNVIEMETAAAFRASKIANIPIAAVFSISDNTIANKSLVSGRAKEEIDFRKYTRKTLFPQIILQTFNYRQNIY